MHKIRRSRQIANIFSSCVSFSVFCIARRILLGGFEPFHFLSVGLPSGTKSRNLNMKALI